MNVLFRPIDVWPGERGSPGWTDPFRTAFDKTLRLLEHEVTQLGAHEIVIQLALSEADIRIDGWPRANVTPAHPGVIVAFESKYGPLKYATNEYPRWQANLRAIALGLEALRKVDRYGITRRGEQYAGWKQLPAGDGPSPDRGRALIREHGGEREALMATHPDHGGNARDFADVQAARS